MTTSSKSIFVSALLVLFLLIGVSLRRSVAMEDLLLSIAVSTPHDVIKAGSDITVQVTLTNVTTRTIAIESNAFLPYRLLVNASDGSALAETDRGRKV